MGASALFSEADATPAVQVAKTSTAPIAPAIRTWPRCGRMGEGHRRNSRLFGVLRAGTVDMLADRGQAAERRYLCR